MSRLLKGVYNSHPPKPRSATWDVDSVIHYLISMGENDESKNSSTHGTGGGFQIIRVTGLGPTFQSVSTLRSDF